MDHLAAMRVIAEHAEQRSERCRSWRFRAEKVAFLIEKAREFDVKEAASDPNPARTPPMTAMIDVLEDNGFGSRSLPR